eukprot:TRINITY_DN16935_c0_g1_i4.p1 TRINITY_DN16935_c0_g1~~TRINITY_DN16935_c0_g1_i4.p1  ORF type:complete len:205 (+),score=46.19 TRINITY_DN16935_c0_g1_i4:540-1154(+)
MIVYKNDNGRSMRVGKEAMKNVAARYNRQCESEFFQLKADDVILAVNGVSGHFSSMMDCFSSRVISLLVARSDQQLEPTAAPQKSEEEAVSDAPPEPLNPELSPAPATKEAALKAEPEARPVEEGALQALPEAQPAEEVKMIAEVPKGTSAAGDSEGPMETKVPGTEQLDVAEMTELKLSPREGQTRCSCSAFEYYCFSQASAG